MGREHHGAEAALQWKLPKQIFWLERQMPHSITTLGAIFSGNNPCGAGDNIIDF